jgi:hypothetical protein
LTHALGTAQLAANAFPLRDQAQLQKKVIKPGSAFHDPVGNN